ncbi:putative toxin-antitoxin system toxin component, PIN family [Lewinella sp. 4G2]|uniref:putative toxin-antitoxin system toxin component, PIN family n=1 Tax=Lewinella sp. 4G2 TaxID=1803372 RepID=UPI0007DF3391|nr:putative toxin-antitoxin system toxin component, PIN family [Lewinella sp. 4G2]OAV45137.1 putative toxin-antitoxin system toxin component, PIN family [Lewinella sp. 4G2]
MRVVLDTNSLIVSIGRKSKFRPIFDSLLHGQITLVVSNDVLSEYVEILEQRTNAIVAENIGNFLMRSPDVNKIEIYFKWAAIYADAHDNKFVDCALNGNAQFIVTDDKHLNVLKETEFPKMKVIRTRDFLNMISEQDGL